MIVENPFWIGVWYGSMGTLAIAILVYMMISKEGMGDNDNSHKI